MNNNITYNKETSCFYLETSNTLYIIKLVRNKYFAQLYYGEKTTFVDEYKPRPLAFASYLDDGEEKIYFETMMAEYPSFGSGDFWADAIRLRNYKGNCVTDFEYNNYEIINGRINIHNLPCANVDNKTQTLVLTLKDNVLNCTLKLCYTVFYDTDIISRHVVLINNGNEDVIIENIKSLNLDIPNNDYDIVTLNGAHYFERTIRRSSLNYGKQVLYSARGTSSHHTNPFVAICDNSADYTKGNVYGFNFIYSGSFENIVEKTSVDKIRIQIGVNGAVEGQVLQGGVEYYTPEAVMTYTNKGLGQMSRNFHSFIKKHIIPLSFNHRHPIVLNTWEAFYFDIDEKKLLKLADVAVDLGIETLVVDDGWFSVRNSDNAGLGDWWVNNDKFPSGLKMFSNKIAKKGLSLGIWIEPEMINPNSELFKKHPEWCLKAYGRKELLSRNQHVLNIALPEVLTYLKETFFQTFKDVKFNYIKWDMNRSLSAVGNNFNGEKLIDNAIARKYIENMYNLHDWFLQTFPGIMIEGCSGGGGRYDMAMMRYTSQIWTSDNTFPADRARIQHGSLLAYPACVMSCHVSNPEESLKKPEEYDYRYKIALQGVLGYEMDLLTLNRENFDCIKKQISEYKRIRDFAVLGNYYPLFAKNETYVHYYHLENIDSFIIHYATQKQVGEKITISIPQASDNDSYIDRKNNKVYKGINIKEGIELTFDKKADYIIIEKQI